MVEAAVNNRDNMAIPQIVGTEKESREDITTTVQEFNRTQLEMKMMSFKELLNYLGKPHKLRKRRGWRRSRRRVLVSRLHPRSRSQESNKRLGLPQMLMALILEQVSKSLLLIMLLVAKMQEGELLMTSMISTLAIW